jgi:uncharacterized protein (TIGR02271 family)
MESQRSERVESLHPQRQEWAEPLAPGETTRPSAATEGEPVQPYSSLAGSPGATERGYGEASLLTEGEQVLELREEELVARKDLRELGEIRVRTQVEELPGRLEVEALREEVEVEHVPVGQVVSERVSPWEENGTLVVPVYEEQLVVVKRLVLREQLRVRRVGTTERRLIEDTLRRERLVIEDPNNTGLVHEQYPAAAEHDERPKEETREREEGGFLGQLVRKAFQ